MKASSGARSGRRRALAALSAGLVAALALLAGHGVTPAAANVDPSSGCSRPTGPVRFTAAFPVDGVQRSALVNVPAQAGKGRPLPLLMMFHGAGGNAEATESYTSLTPMGARAGFIVVYPNANGKYWNLTGGGSTGADDVEFVRSLLDQLDSVVCIDDSRVYAAGVSNGGGFVSRLGCDLNRRLAGIATVAGLYGREPACEPEHALSVLEVHGTGDQTVPYNGWPAGNIASVGSFLNKWNQWDSCPSGPGPWQRLGPATLLQVKTGCADGTKIEHVKLGGEPHVWPSSASWAEGSPSQPVPFDASTAVMQFFANGTVSPQPLPRVVKRRRGSSRLKHAAAR